jgi:hypothetical protein
VAGDVAAAAAVAVLSVVAAAAAAAAAVCVVGDNDVHQSALCLLGVPSSLVTGLV